MIHEYTLHCKLSQYAYLSHEKFISRVSKEFAFTSEFSSIDGSDVAVCWNRTRAIIVCRGTQATSWNDVKADMKAYKTKFQDICWTHDGFKDEVEKNLEWVKSVFLKRKLYSKEITVCGHSLGGAMAHLFALYMSNKHNVPVKLYTYGSPRVGGWSFNKAMKQSNIEHHRFRNNNDVVPSVPFAILGYQHFGELHYINHYGNIRKQTYWQRLKDKLRGRWRALQKGQPFDGVFDHSIGLYKKKIEKQFN
jgi:predicted lipase